jgi:hypothetical protein
MALRRRKKGWLLVFVVLVFSIFIPGDVGACDFMALLTQRDCMIAQYTGIGNYEYPADFFQFLRDRSTQNLNNDGYGVIYYRRGSPTILYGPDNESIFTQAFYLLGFYTWYGKQGNPVPEPLDVAEDRVMNEDLEAVIVMGHDRNGSGGIGQHPFRFEWENSATTFCLQHNGDINAYTNNYPPLPWSYVKEQIIHFLRDDPITGDPLWFVHYPLNWIESGTTPFDPGDAVDSELLLHFIMWHLINNNCSVETAIASALNHDILREILYDHTDSYEANFVFSNAKALYIVRTSHYDISNPDFHNISYRDYRNGLVAVKTQADIPNGGVRVPDNALVVISRQGDIVTHPNIVCPIHTGSVTK